MENFLAFDEFLEFAKRFDVVDLIVVSINIVLMIFAARIMRVIYHGHDDDKRFILKVRIFRAFNLAIMFAFVYYHMVLPVSEKGPGFKILSLVIILYLSYVVMIGLNTFVHARYGKKKEVDGTNLIVETYNSRLISIVLTILISVIVIVSVVRILGFESWLEAGGVLGVIGVFLALTQNVWAPDLFSGLIMLNSGMLETGDVIEFNAEERGIGVVHKTRLFHTEILNLINNHRIMIRNARLRDLVIHNLSKFASAKGLRERLVFKIGYDVSPERARKMFLQAFDIVTKTEGINIESQHEAEIHTIDAGDHAIEYAFFYYTKDVRNLLRTRFRITEVIILQAQEEGIHLSTPTLHVAYLEKTH
ncbi:MAG: mechanosensitive ion channel family protein [Gammaproteobacteria bacterium]|nr:mechanosensitive ion channel family protein [Gammaproteobacteria bacterium]MDH5693249.1 mechanosensitive ion channel family protein [Gammaproteobacteria bacterium]